MKKYIVKQQHSLDICWHSLLTNFQWMNPFHGFILKNNYGSKLEIYCQISTAQSHSADKKSLQYFIITFKRASSPKTQTSSIHFF